jgi:hypothetical protein
MRLFPVLLALAPGAVLAASAPPAPVASNPLAFFNGHTESHGIARIVFRSPIKFAVHSSGHIEAGDVLVLDQVIDKEGEPAEKREWRIRRSGGTRFVGSLSNATGPVTGSINGNTVRMKYRLRDNHLTATQEIQMQPDGRGAFNRIILSRFGINLVTIEETIRK